MKLHVAVCAVLVCSGISSAAPEAAPRLEVFPARIALELSRDFQSVVVRSVEPDGTTRDLTREASYEVADPAVARIKGTVLRPRADGTTTLRVTAAGRTQSIPVTVTEASATRPISFKLDVMAALSRSGCNTGDCHGSARGQDGFHLSLFGYDPDGDYHALTREIPGRRVNLALPEASMLLEKATGAVPHTGGTLFEKESPRYRTIHDWLAAGAPRDPADIPHVVGIEIVPQDVVLKGTGATQQMLVQARYSDGTDRDVTSLAVFMSNNKPTATAAGGGTVKAGQRGEALIMARFDAYTVGSQVIVIPRDAPDAFPELPASNYIDELIAAKLRKLRVLPSGLCSDEVFLRRAYVDIVGLLPPVEAYRSFVADTDPAKREKLVDELLERKEFVELWVMQWAERLQIRSTNEVSYKAMLLYYNWLQERLASGVPLNRIARDLIASRGGTFAAPATNYYQAERDTLKVSENVAQTFLGMRLQCAQCHNHPFDRWRMDDYYGFAAFFSQIGRKRAEDPRETIVFDRRSGEVRHPVGNRVMAPKFLGGAEPDVRRQDRRAVLAAWLSSKENRYFAENAANFVWAHFFGRGIVDPVDDVRVSNPPSNRRLLAALADRLVAYDYDFKRLVRDITTSRAYARATATNETNALDDSNFSHGAIRRIRAEVLLDCISQVTATKNKFKGLPRGARAVQIADGNVTNYFLTTFGRAKRETVCTCEVVMEPNLSQALHLINGRTVHQRIREGGVVKKLRAEKKSVPEIIEHLYIACLSRKPTAEERKTVEALVAEDANTERALGDLFWSLLNAKEFIFNH
jgi:hypothetical protein